MSRFITSLSDFYRIWVKDLFHTDSRYVPAEHTLRGDVETDLVRVCIHEWGGYGGRRNKNIRRIAPFECGLDFQLKRFREYDGKRPLSLTLTMSEPFRHPGLEGVKSMCDVFMPVSNQGMDFSGYSAFVESLKGSPNGYIILTNSSINSLQEDFLDSYIDFMEAHPEVGLLGVSSSSKYYQTFRRHNFNPHLQSFFILTTKEVIERIVALNGGVFPGIDQTNKHLLIRNGEVLLSSLALDAGYRLAVVKDGRPYIFDRSDYPFPPGDLRIYIKYPNAIQAISEY